VSDERGMGGGDGTEGAGTPPDGSGSYGERGHAMPDPKQPVTSMDTAADRGEPDDE
jgi:hypothetical protein